MKEWLTKWRHIPTHPGQVARKHESHLAMSWWKQKIRRQKIFAKSSSESELSAVSRRYCVNSDAWWNECWPSICVWVRFKLTRRFLKFVPQQSYLGSVFQIPPQSHHFLPVCCCWRGHVTCQLFRTVHDVSSVNGKKIGSCCPFYSLSSPPLTLLVRPRGRDFLGKCVARDSSFDHQWCQEP